MVTARDRLFPCYWAAFRTDSTAMAIRWKFIEDNEQDAAHWAWHCMRVNDTIEKQSLPFASYGAAVDDAIRCGFRPVEQHFVLVTPCTVTHFRPGDRPVTMPIGFKAGTDDEVVQRFRGMTTSSAPRRYLAAPKKNPVLP
jgi:hypothetical protein